MFAGLLFLCVGLPPESPLPPAASEARKDALARFGAGVWQARRERLLSAAKSLEAAAKQDPDSTAALQELVSVYARIGREPEAIRAARTVMERRPTDAATAHKLARLLGDLGETLEAIDFARIAAEHTDATEWPEKSLAAIRDLATLLERAGQRNEAARAWRQAVDLLVSRRKAILAIAAFSTRELDVETADASERLGHALVKAGDSAGAAAAFQAAHKLYSDPARVNDPAAAARLGWNLSAAFAASNPAAALKHLEAFLKLQPQAPEPFERLVELTNAVRPGTDVVPVLEAHLAKDPRNSPLRAVLALEQCRDGSRRKAGDDAFIGLLAVHADPKTLRLALKSCLETNRASHAIDLIDSAYAALKDEDAKNDPARTLASQKARGFMEILRAEPDWAAAVLRAAADDLKLGRSRVHATWMALASLAARHGKLDFAAKQYEQAIRTAPINAQGEAYTQLIHVLRRGRKPAELEAVCREGLRNTNLFPAFFHYHLAHALAELGDAEGAIASADKAIAQSGAADRLAIRLQKVYVLNRLEKWDESVALCKKLLAEFDDAADRLRLRYSLATALWGAKKSEESEAELRAILETDPDYASACNDLGYHLAEQGRNLDEAERLIRRAIAIDRVDRRRAGDADLESAPYLDSLAWLLMRREKLPEARDILVRVSAMPEGSVDGVVWDHLGDVHFRLGDKEKAAAAWAEAAKLLATDSRGRRDGRLDELKKKLKRVP